MILEKKNFHDFMFTRINDHFVNQKRNELWPKLVVRIDKRTEIPKIFVNKREDTNKRSLDNFWRTNRHKKQKVVTKLY